MVTVLGITKRFGSRVAVEDVSFEVPEGAVTALLGPNGAGKTTTMRIIAGYYVPDAGEVTVNGVSVVERPIDARRAIGYLPESNPLYRDLLVSEYLDFAGRAAHLTTARIRARLAEVVPVVGITDVFYRPIAELSKGYRQRVGLAGVLVADPAVLILDEPTEGLDPNQRSDMRDLLTSLAKDKTVIVSTHVLSEAQAIASHVVVLNAGRVARTGTLADVLARSGASHVHLSLEGSGVADLLTKLPSVTAVEKRAEGATIPEYTVAVTDRAVFARDLSALIGRSKLIIHRLEPGENDLEAVFSDLTRTTTFTPEH